MIDFEPVLIQYYPERSNNEVSWVHPHIGVLCEFEQPSWIADDGAEFSEAHGVHRLYLDNADGETTYVVFKSKFFDDMLETICKGEDEVYEPAASQSMKRYGLSR